MSKIIETISSPEDLRRLYKEHPESISDLCREIRVSLVDSVAKNGGHLASNLGVVELTLALHLAFDANKDTIVFDVGHQSYVHKMITGRYDRFTTLRTKNGISGFPKRSESIYDKFNTGHASTSVSAVTGVARANEYNGRSDFSVAVIGDAALMGGMVFEALNDAGQRKTPMIIVLNDNNMAISGTVGAMGSHLTKLRTSRRYLSFKHSTYKFLTKIPKIGEALAEKAERLKNRFKYFILPDVIFESIGVKYIGPVDGHNIEQLIETFSYAKRLNQPVLVHAVTKKGKGYRPAETDPEDFHGIGPFDVHHPFDKLKGKICNSSVFADELIKIADSDKEVVAITAAMPSGTGLIPFSERYPERFFDVGIAEQHAVTMAAGMTVGGLKPYVAIYSTFLQRAYDQILHDVCLQNLPVVFCIDRAGLVGEDGETHQGVYDIAYMLTMPGIVILSPASVDELREMLWLAKDTRRPIAIRYNRGLLPDIKSETKVEIGKWEEIRPIRDLTVIATGRLVSVAVDAVNGLDVGVINARSISPMDFETLRRLKTEAKAIITVEDGIVTGGFGAKVAQFLSTSDVSVYNMGVPNIPIPHASIREQDELCGISSEAILVKVIDIIGEMNK